MNSPRIVLVKRISPHTIWHHKTNKEGQVLHARRCAYVCGRVADIVKSVLDGFEVKCDGQKGNCYLADDFWNYIIPDDFQKAICTLID